MKYRHSKKQYKQYRQHSIINMKHTKRPNWHIVRRYQIRSWYLSVILFFCAVGAVLYWTRIPVISPCPDAGCKVNVLYVKEHRSELEEMINYIVKTFEKEGNVVVFQAMLIAQCESRWNPKAYNYNTNGTSDYGLFQINTVHVLRYGTGFYYDWKQNVDVAYKIYKQSGWNPWVCKEVL